MWTIIKIDKKRLSFLKSDLRKKLEGEINYYYPKFLIRKSQKNKENTQELPLMGDYLFCFNKKFSDPLTLYTVK